MKKQIVVIGLGRFGTSMATTLAGMGHDVLAIDSNETKVKNISSVVTHSVQADVTNEAVLKDLGVGNFDIGVVGIGYNILNSILATTILKKLGVKYIVARAMDELHGGILTRVGADTVVYPESEAGERVAHSITSVYIMDNISLFGQYGVTLLQAPPYFEGKNLTDLGFGRASKLGIAVLLIQRQKEVIVTPDRMETVRKGDMLIVSGTDTNLETLLAEAKKRESNG
jgi:trk system potassium uptake protein